MPPPIRLRDDLPDENTAEYPARKKADPPELIPTPPKAPEELTAGTLVGDYTILEQIGAGGTAYVYKAQDSTGQLWAIKLYREDRLEDTVWWMFQQEVERMQTLKHPNIVSLKGFGYHGRQPYLVLPYLPDGVSQRLAKGKFSVQETVEILLQLCSALAYLHEQGFIHGDIKPHNILIDERGKVQLIDFGIMRPATLFSRIDHRDQFAGRIVGAVPYLKPEVLVGAETTPTPSWDLYAFGITLYEMLAGVRPPVCNQPTLYHNRSRDAAVPSVRKLVPSVPKTLDEIIRRCCVRSGGYINAGQLLLVLKQWKNRWHVRYLVCAIVALLGVVWWGLLSMQPPVIVPRKESPSPYINTFSSGQNPASSKPYRLDQEQIEALSKILTTKRTFEIPDKKKGDPVAEDQKKQAP